MKILMLGDSPYLRTGFAVVNKIATDHLKSLGHEVLILGSQDSTHRGQGFIPVDTRTTDRMGWLKVEDAIDAFEPDAIHLIGDAAMTCVWRSSPKVAALPMFAYVPIEGAPSNFEWMEIFRAAENLTLYTCSDYGQRTLAADGVTAGMAYHGVSSDFRPISADRRATWRKALGWENRFIVMNVAQNVRRKQWPRLFEAIRLLVKHHPEVYLYAHTTPFANYWLEGHHLGRLADEMGIWDHVIFPPTHKALNDWSELHGTEMPGLVDMYGVADCFVLPSQVEGFGLPLAEAMACGLPVVTTNYGAQAEVVGKAGMLIDPYDWEINKSHARYANLNPQDIATGIRRLIKSPELRRAYAAKGIERAKAFQWDDYRAALTGWASGTEKEDQTPQDTPQLQEVG